MFLRNISCHQICGCPHLVALFSNSSTYIIGTFVSNIYLVVFYTLKDLKWITYVLLHTSFPTRTFNFTIAKVPNVLKTKYLANPSVTITLWTQIMYVLLLILSIPYIIYILSFYNCLILHYFLCI